MPIKVADCDLSQGIETINGLTGYESLRILVRYHGHPIGWVVIPNEGRPAVSHETVRNAIIDQLGIDLVPAVLGAPPSVEVDDAYPAIPISVVICTHDRPGQLRKTLTDVLKLEYPNYEIIVIDNASTTDETADVVAEFPVRYVYEERLGLDWARNRGIAAAQGDVIAFTDDDARPDRQWLQAIARTFRDPEMMAVTGFVAPTELETPAQRLFEFGYGGMGHGFHRRVIQRSRLADQELLWASSFGVGANMAFRREVFDAVGPFDVALDVGTPSGGGGDIEMFHRLVASGFTLVYEPRALVWHTHRRTFASLRQQLYDNGRGFGAYLLTCLRNGTVDRLTILRFVVREWIGWWLVRRLVRPNGFPRHLVAIELAGALSSRRAYKKAHV